MKPHEYTQDEIRQWLNGCKSVGIEPDMAGQLLATMERQERLKNALVIAVLPLEALRLSGMDTKLSPDMQHTEGIAAVRAAIADEPRQNRDEREEP